MCMSKTFIEIISERIEGNWVNKSGQSVKLFQNIICMYDCDEIIGLDDIFTKQ